MTNKRFLICVILFLLASFCVLHFRHDRQQQANYSSVVSCEITNSHEPQKYRSTLLAIFSPEELHSEEILLNAVISPSDTMNLLSLHHASGEQSLKISYDQDSFDAENYMVYILIDNQILPFGKYHSDSHKIKLHDSKYEEFSIEKLEKEFTLNIKQIKAKFPEYFIQ